ncbi:MAG: STAS/SEC14 domain-containing protein [Stappiaceae bacterium]
MTDPSPSTLEVLTGFPDNVVAVKAKGKITGSDYEKVLIPLCEAVFAKHGKARVLYWCGPEFEGFSASAMFDDTWFGMKHIGDFDRIAVVSDHQWLINSIRFFAPLTPIQMRTFGDDAIEDAKAWIVETDG